MRIKSGASRLRFKNVVIDSFEVRTMSFDDLYSPVRAVPAFAEKVQESLADGGMENPIIVVRGPREDFLRYLREGTFRPSDKNPPPNIPEQDVLNVVWGGTNRILALKNLGYDAADCLIVPDFYTGSKLQGEQRAAYERQRRGQSGAAGTSP